MSRPLADWSCFFEAYLSLAAARVILITVPFRMISRHLGSINLESSKDPEPHHEAQLARIRWALSAASRRTPWRSTCLVRALAGRVMLRHRHISSTLYLGVNPGSFREALNAHAWLRSGSALITGGKEQTSFTAIASFGDGELKE